MKFMITLTGTQQEYDAMAGKGTAEKPAWTADEIQAMYKFMGELNADLTERGEFVDGQGLTDPSHARQIRLTDGEIVVTDGPYAETAEVLAGYWIVDVDGIDRATEIASKIATCPVPEQWTGTPIYIRLVEEEPEEAAVPR